MEAELRELIAKKDALETEIKQLNHKCEAIDQSKCKDSCMQPSPRTSWTLRDFPVLISTLASWPTIATPSADLTNSITTILRS